MRCWRRPRGRVRAGAYCLVRRTSLTATVAPGRKPWKKTRSAGGGTGRVTRPSADFGVLFGDAAGETTIERSYWSNRSANFSSHVPGEAMLYPNFWGTVELR